jgi:PKD repeat protein
MHKTAAISIILLSAFLAASFASGAPLPAPRHIFIDVANDAGVKWDWDSIYYGAPGSTANGTYYIKADGGGLNELHITNDVTSPYGQLTASNNVSGVFYVTNTGGRGYDNEIILLLSVKPPIPDDFAVRIRASGYNWTPAPPGPYTPLELPSDYYHIDGALDEVFTRSDFIYGPETWKPGPGDLLVPSLPLYNGQDISDGSTEEYLMFIDLYAGNMYPEKFGTTLVDNGAVKVEYSFTKMTTFAAFNGYGWCSAANQDEGISWTNRIVDVGASGYTVEYVPPSPLPFPGKTSPPTDPDGDGICEDMNGNGFKDFNDVVLFFKQMEWVQANEPVELFDFNHNGYIDFNDIVRLFREL